MPTYAQFFQESTGYVPGSIPPRFDDAHRVLIEVCGDRGVIRIDGRLSSREIGVIAERTCKERGFSAWQILKGASLLTATQVSYRHRVHYGPEDKTAMSASYGA